MKRPAGVKSGWRVDIGLLILRLAGIGLALAHGWPKVARFVSGEGEQFFQGVERMGFPFAVAFGWAAALSELVGGFLIALGLLTRVASLFAAFTMATAAFLQHRLAQQSLAFFGLMEIPEDVVESYGNPERAAVYLLVFLALIFLGGGRFSLDRLLRRGR
jgi:putative oxidoreductase